MNEPRHIREVMIRSLEAQIRAMSIQIQELIEIKAAWSKIEALMDTRDELEEIVSKLKNTEQE